MCRFYTNVDDAARAYDYAARINAKQAPLQVNFPDRGRQEVVANPRRKRPRGASR